MATIRLITRPSSKPGAPPVYYIRIIHRRACKAVSTRVACDGTAEALARAETKLQPYLRAIESLETSGAGYGIDEILALADGPAVTADIIEYVLRHVQELKDDGRLGTAKIFKKLANNLSAFLGTGRWLLHRTDRARIWAFCRYLAGRGIKRNTLAAYMRPLRRILRKAHDDGLLDLDSGWFTGIPFGIDKTEKRAIRRADMQRIAGLDLTHRPRLALCRDLFLFSFYAMGMPFVDLAHLTQANLHGDCLVYRRHKTNQLITVPLDHKLRDIIHRYADPRRLRLFPAMGQTAAITYDSALRTHNKLLKQIGSLAGVAVPLTSYVTRHTWATLAREVNTPVGIISEALGHTSERTTRIYLDSIGNNVLAEANRRITDLSRPGPKKGGAAVHRAAYPAPKHPYG